MPKRPAPAVAGLATTLALLAGCSPTPAPETETVLTHALYPSYRDSTELLTDADLVIRGVPTAARVEQLFMDPPEGTDPLTNPQAGLPPEEVERIRQDSATVVTVTTVRVTEVVKGTATVGGTVDVSQLGGTFKGVRYREGSTTMLSQGGAEYVMFLAAHGAGRPYDLLNPQQGLYTVGTGGALNRADGGADSLGVESVRGLQRQASALD
ncbi:hypothetical protein [Spirilliplanes yamanashiensis]|uniref:Lipoprotein n=1 Tax=Spirilliplanes yamanashiensis TaxID=42233 RepID=A0A8J4DK66_9ACTN|nr:hypothetical protein [Spirilliplanes yamanashiensis]MDP9815719.1 hypothetical protein [Spirilliplanes yamanashiensis]GIJ03973.1 hypothetical protein Sya03_33250 [Spirilliplanes yamanashiensis]